MQFFVDVTVTVLTFPIAIFMIVSDWIIKESRETKDMIKESFRK